MNEIPLYSALKSGKVQFCEVAQIRLHFVSEAKNNIFLKKSSLNEVYGVKKRITTNVDFNFLM